MFALWNYNIGTHYWCFHVAYSETLESSVDSIVISNHNMLMLPPILLYVHEVFDIAQVVRLSNTVII